MFQKRTIVFPFFGIGSAMLTVRRSACLIRQILKTVRMVDKFSDIFPKNCGFICVLQIVLLLACLGATDAKTSEHKLHWQSPVKGAENIVSHSCIHDQILEQRRQPGRKVYTVTPQVYEASGVSKPLYRKGRALLGIPQQSDAKQPIRIYLNYDAVGHSPDRDCRNIGDIVKVSLIVGSVSFGLMLFLGCICDLGLVWFLIHFNICFYLTSLGSLLCLLFPDLLLAILMEIPQFLVTVGITVPWMI